MMIAICALSAMQASADGLRFNLGVSPHGTSFSVGYSDPGPVRDHGRDRRCNAVPPPPRVRYVARRGHYENRVERYWVDGYWSRLVYPDGRLIEQWNPGYWAERNVQVWVSH